VARGDAERTRDLPLRRVAVDDTNLPRESRAMATSSRGIPRTTAGGAGGTSATRASFFKVTTARKFYADGFWPSA
jgi:hypothetical protein